MFYIPQRGWLCRIFGTLIMRQTLRLLQWIRFIFEHIYFEDSDGRESYQKGNELIMMKKGNVE